MENAGVTYGYFFIDTSDKLKFIYKSCPYYIVNTSGQFIGMGYTYSTSSQVSNATVYDVDLDNLTLINPTTYSSNTWTYTSSSSTSYNKICWYQIPNMKSSSLSTSNSQMRYQYYIMTQGGSSYKSIETIDLRVYEDSYVPAPTQYDATPEYVYDKVFLGKNGAETGTLTSNTSNNLADVDAEVYSKIQDYYDTLEPLILTDSNVDNAFKYKYRQAKALPTKSDGTQFLNIDALSSVAALFYDFSNIRTIPVLNTGHMHDFSIMLNNCQSLTHIPNIDTSNATDMSSMFGYCHNLKSIPNLNTSKVTNMYRMFVRCNNLTTIPNLDTSNVTNMSYMFSGCTNLINIPNLNTTKTTKFDHMFENCQNFDFNNMSNFNTSNASSVTYMFQNCINMTDAPMIDTSNVIDIDAIYYDCYGLVNVPALNTAKARDFSYCFCDCYNLVNIPVWNTSNIVDIRNCFVNCINLSNQSLDNILSMCASATKITNSNRRKLNYIGLTQDQTNVCKNLPNYSAFTSAGWSTGY